jgi:hypothetical protein
VGFITFHGIIELFHALCVLYRSRDLAGVWVNSGIGCTAGTNWDGEEGIMAV